jgi:phytoene dehydrogenase-like protein
MLYKLMTMSSADFLDEWFETDALKATMSASGIIGTFLGPRSPGTAYVQLHHYMGEIDGAFRAWGFARGGTGAVAEAIASSARELGVTIRNNTTVEQVIVRGGRAVGVALDDGTEIRARTVISGLDPRRTFLSLVDDGDLPQDFVRSIRRYRSVGSSGKVNLALGELPNFTSLPGDGDHLRGAISISPSQDYLERAYDDAKYGEFSRHPYMDVIIPSLIDPGMAPPGKHVMSCFVQYAPYKLNGGWNDEKREAFGDAVVDTLSQYAPNLKNAIIHRQVVTPQDMEDEFGLTGGNIFHGELSLQQLFFLRPAPRWANYRTPIRDLYLCGSGAHPGGGICGGPGRLAALEILKGGAR